MMILTGRLSYLIGAYQKKILGGTIKVCFRLECASIHSSFISIANGNPQVFVFLKLLSSPAYEWKLMLKENFNTIMILIKTSS
jgi:hypothetical protein